MALTGTHAAKFWQLWSQICSLGVCIPRSNLGVIAAVSHNAPRPGLEEINAIRIFAILVAETVAALKLKPLKAYSVRGLLHQ